MTERRRSLFVLLLVLGLIAASIVAVATKPTRLGLDLKGGVQLVYEAKPTAQQPTVNQEALARALDIMRQRVDAFGVSEPELQQLGGTQIQVNLPGDGPAVLLRLGSQHPRRELQDRPGPDQRWPGTDHRLLPGGPAGVEVPGAGGQQ